MQNIWGKWSLWFASGSPICADNLLWRLLCYFLYGVRWVRFYINNYYLFEVPFLPIKIKPYIRHYFFGASSESFKISIFLQRLYFSTLKNIIFIDWPTQKSYTAICGPFMPRCTGCFGASILIWLRRRKWNFSNFFQKTCITLCYL